MKRLAIIIAHLAIVFAAGVLPAVTEAQTYTFINIADSSGTLGTNFGYPDINDAGTVAFWAILDDGSTAIYTGNGGPLTLQVTNQGAYTSLANAPTINNSGAVGFWAESPNPVGRGIYRVHNGVTTTIANSSNSFFYDFNEYPSINDSGDVGFKGHLYSPCCNTAIGTSAGTMYDTAGPFLVFDAVTMNNNGAVAFNALLDTAVSGIFTGSGGGHTTIATNANTFSWFVLPATINDSGNVAFIATLVGGAKGIFIGNGGPITTVTTTAGPYSNFSLQGLGFNNNGDMVFRATLADGFTHGIFTGPDPVTDTVIKVGDTLFGAPVASLDVLRGLNNNGDIVFTYVLENASGGIGIAGVAVAVAPTAAIPGDLNGDGQVNVDDLLLLLAAWGECPKVGDCPGDIAPPPNGDGVVNVDDLLVLLGNWG